MKSKNQFWPPIKQLLNAARGKSLFILALVTLGLPIIESILTAIWSSAPDATKSAPGWTLFAVVVIHIVLGAFLICDQLTTQPHSVLASAFEVEENATHQRAELRRREITYGLVRSAFDRLTLQTCNIEYDPGTEAWCLGGFNTGLNPVLAPFIEHSDTALGVVGKHFTLEAYFGPGLVPVRGTEEVGPNRLGQHYFSGTHVDRCAGVCLEPQCSPALQGIEAGAAFEQHIENNRQLFYSHDEPKESIYFRRYAVYPITEPCSREAIGVLVLTSMQDEPFADDVLDTMAFLETLVSNYLAAYRRCFDEHNESSSA